MEISKAEFIRRITKGKSIFTAMTLQNCNIPEYVKTKQNARIQKAEHRTCKAMSGQHLVFSNGKEQSHLYLADVKPHTFYKCYAEGNMLFAEQKYIDECPGFPTETRYKTLCYELVED